VFWQTIWRFLHTWWGFGSAVAAGVAALYYGPKQMLEVWDWYLDRYRDYKVWDIVKKPKVWHFMSPTSHRMVDAPYSVKEIANEIKWRPNSVRKIAA
jgi:hypothetical protein